MSDLVRKYEMIYIHPGNLAGEDVDQITEMVNAILEKMGGELIHREDWGVRTLAYQVRKQHEGRYILTRFACAVDCLNEIERRLRISETVIKYLTVRLPDDFVQEEIPVEEEEVATEGAEETVAPAAPEAAAETASEETPAAAPAAETETSENPGEK